MPLTHTMHVFVTPEEAVAIAKHPELAELTARLVGNQNDLTTHAASIEKARELYVTDEVEIDDRPLISEGGDPGRWVSAWVWVSDASLNA